MSFGVVVPSHHESCYRDIESASSATVSSRDQFRRMSSCVILKNHFVELSNNYCTEAFAHFCSIRGHPFDVISLLSVSRSKRDLQDKRQAYRRLHTTLYEITYSSDTLCSLSACQDVSVLCCVYRQNTSLRRLQSSHSGFTKRIESLQTSSQKKTGSNSLKFSTASR